jgi:DNA polymerase-3 subunit epsilon
MKTLYFDVETSGTDDKVNGILQLAGTIECEERGKERFSFHMKPFPDQIIEDSALEANGITRAEIESFADPVVCYDEFLRIIGKYVGRYDKTDKLTLIGYNSRFDDGFLREWFTRCGADKFTYGSHFWWPAIDVSNMVAVKYRESRSDFENFKLMTVAKTLGIKVDEERAHEAGYDVLITKAVYLKCLDVC